MSKRTLSDHIAAREALIQEKDAFENAYETHFTPLRDGVWSTQPEAETHVQSLIPLFNKFDYEESLINAFRPAAHRKPCDRRHFDKIVVDQAEKSFLQHKEDLERNIMASEPGIDRARSAVEFVESAVSEARESDRAVALTLGKAIMAQRSSQCLLRDAKKAYEKFPNDSQQAEIDRAAANRSLQEFRRGPYEAYTYLSNRIAALEALELVTPSVDNCVLGGA